MRLPKLYPDLPLPRLGYIVADLIVLFWIAAWVFVGNAVYNAVMTLSIIANGVITTGQKVNDAVNEVQQSLSNVPLAGGGLHDALTPLHRIPAWLIVQGHDELQAIQQLAWILAVIVAGVPLLAALLVFIPWRIRKTSGFRNLDRLLHTPGASSVTATMQVLAARALYTLPYDRLLHYSADPIGEWRAGRHYNLARAVLAEEGLEMRRYLRRLEGLPPVPDLHDLPLIQDDDQ
jgi:hypothetical protein